MTAATAPMYSSDEIEITPVPGREFTYDCILNGAIIGASLTQLAGEELIEEVRYRALVSDPPILDQLADKALADYQAGRTTPLTPETMAAFDALLDPPPDSPDEDSTGLGDRESEGDEVRCPECGNSDCPGNAPAPTQSGLCWCWTWRTQGHAGECPDCRWRGLNKPSIEYPEIGALVLLSAGVNACTICGGAHRPTQCPRMADAPIYLCTSCDDLTLSPGLCQACIEAGETDPATQPADAMRAIAA